MMADSLVTVSTRTQSYTKPKSSLLFDNQQHSKEVAPSEKVSFLGDGVFSGVSRDKEELWAEKLRFSFTVPPRTCLRQYQGNPYTMKTQTRGICTAFSLGQKNV